MPLQKQQLIARCAECTLRSPGPSMDCTHRLLTDLQAAVRPIHGAAAEWMACSWQAAQPIACQTAEGLCVGTLLVLLHTNLCVYTQYILSTGGSSGTIHGAARHTQMATTCSMCIRVAAYV
jgi:hypothetical protein